ncbi:MAG: FkbM family methyltransferase [Nitrospirae bacterium]|nr:FkbM family methyltransferase [Nitrospirota bacterium]
MMTVLNSSIKLLQGSELLQRHKGFKTLLKRAYMTALKIATRGKGINKNIGAGGAFRFDYTFAFSDFQSWGTGHNNAFQVLLKMCEGRKVVFDVGAHVGLCSMPVSRVIGEGGVVYAFEPSKTNMDRLSKNLAYNNIDNVKLLPHLVGDKSRANVPFHESYEVTGMNSIARYKGDDTYSITYKDQVSIDDFCADHDIIPEIIKIDVEGAESGVLRGAENVLRNHRPVIVLSVHPRHLQLLGDSVDNLKNIIEGVGYGILDMNGAPAGELGFREYLLKPLPGKSQGAPCPRQRHIMGASAKGTL